MRRVRFAAAVVATGVGAGLAGAALTALLRLVQHTAYDYSSGPFLTAVDHASDLRRVVVLSLAGLVCSVAWFLVRRTLIHASLPHVIADAAIQVVSVAMGSPLGREGAPRLVGSAFGSRLAHATGLSARQVTVLAACGGGAGMAAVYDVPFGGALFAVEVLLVTFGIDVLVTALVTSWIATLVAGVYVPPTYVLVHAHLQLREVLVGLALGALAGVLSVPLVRLWIHVRARALHGWRIVPVLSIAFVLLGLVSTVRPELLGNGRNVVQLALDGDLGLAVALIVLVAKPLVTAGVLRAGGRGGLFTPVLSVGATLGAATAHVLPGVPAGPTALVAAVALLAATSQGPLSALVLVVELTQGSTAVVLPAALASLTAWQVSRQIDGRSLYGHRGPSLTDGDPIVAGLALGHRGEQGSPEGRARVERAAQLVDAHHDRVDRARRRHGRAARLVAEQRHLPHGLTGSGHRDELVVDDHLGRAGEDHEHLLSPLSLHGEPPALLQLDGRAQPSQGRQLPGAAAVEELQRPEDVYLRIALHRFHGHTLDEVRARGSDQAHRSA